MIEKLQQMGNVLASLPNHPTTVLLLLGTPLLLLAWRRRIFPALPLVMLSLIPCVLTCGLFLRRDFLPVIVALDLAVLVVALFDLARIPRAKEFSIDRTCQRIASLRKNHDVTLVIGNTTSRTARLKVRDGVPDGVDCKPQQFEISIPAKSRATLDYQLEPQRRGAFHLDAVHLMVRSSFGLWQKLVQYPLDSVIHVYPDLKQISQYSLLARTNRLSLVGVRRTRRVGRDNEFERLRDYTLDDAYKHIDWRSTARRNKLTVKDFQSNQSQRVMFMVDCGRMMTNWASGLTLLDHALNAALMLGYVALDQGDAVGLITFSDRVHSCVPARSGRNQMNRLLHAAFDRFPQLVESRYGEAFFHLSARCRKRSLVVLMTHLIDEVNSDQVSNYLTAMARHHLPLCVVLRDRQMFDAVANAGASPNDLYRGAAAAGVLSWRHQVISDLEHRGVLVIDEYPEQLTAPLINRYLAIKAQHLL